MYESCTANHIILEFLFYVRDKVHERIENYILLFPLTELVTEV